MRHARRAEREPARRQIHSRVADVEREISFDHVEPLVLVRVDVPRGSEPRRHQELNDTGGRYGLIEFLAPPGLGSPWHVRTDEDEWCCVVAGNATLYVCSSGVGRAAGVGG